MGCGLVATGPHSPSMAMLGAPEQRKKLRLYQENRYSDAAENAGGLIQKALSDGQINPLSQRLDLTRLDATPEYYIILILLKNPRSQKIRDIKNG
jgi:hypothetical protein